VFGPFKLWAKNDDGDDNTERERGAGASQS
jgi:hypothetical protein